MTDRITTITQALAGSVWAGWSRHALAGDASARRYERLTNPQNGQTVILMDAPPHNGEDTRPFEKIARYLTQIGLRAPEILFGDANLGILILEDMGDDLFARWLESGSQDAPLLYRAAVDVLVTLSRETPPDGLQRLDPHAGAQMIDLATQWYAPNTSQADETALKNCLEDALYKFADGPYGLALRDYHAENLVWLPHEKGVARVGLLDFQDALLAHPAYDLVSLLGDARRDVPLSLRSDMTRYFAERTGQDHAPFERACALWGVQRNLRILGIFARLALRDGKIRYLDLIPRVRGNLMYDLNHPDLADLRKIVVRILPAPSAASLANPGGSNA